MSLQLASECVLYIIGLAMLGRPGLLVGSIASYYMHAPSVACRATQLLQLPPISNLPFYRFGA